MFKKISFLILLVMVGFNALAYAMPPRPANCPSASMIKSSGFSYAIPGDNGYTLAQYASYGTNDMWLFGFVEIQADSAAGALSIGKQLLDTLFGSPQPMALTTSNAWGCLYQTAQGTYGIAITPVNMSTALNRSLLRSLH